MELESLENFHEHSLLKVKAIKDFKCTICKKECKLSDDLIYYFCFQCDLYICQPCLKVLNLIKQNFDFHSCQLILTKRSYKCDMCKSKNKKSFSMCCEKHDIDICLFCFFKYIPHEYIIHEHCLRKENNINLKCTFCEEEKNDDFYLCDKCNLNICSNCNNNFACFQNLKNQSFYFYLSKKNNLIEENNKLNQEIEFFKKTGYSGELMKNYNEIIENNLKLNKENEELKRKIKNLENNIKELNTNYSLLVAKIKK